MSWSIVKKAVQPSDALSASKVPSLGRVEVMLSEWRGCAGTISVLSWLDSTSLVWNCICFSVVICRTTQLRDFCLGYGGIVYSCWGEWLCCYMLLDLGHLSGHVLDCILLSLGDWAVLLQSLSELCGVSCRGWYSGSGHCSYNIPYHRLDSCFAGGSGCIGGAWGGWLGCPAEWRKSMKMLLWGRWGHSILSP